MAITERRAFPLSVEVRDGEGFNFDGLASVYDVTTDLGPFRERVADTAFTKTLKDQADVKLLVNHEGVPLARTKSGTLMLESSEIGLRAFTPEDKPLDSANPTVQEVRSAMARGDLDQMSFAFIAVKEEWDDQPEDGGSAIRTIREAKLFDVSIVTDPAYEDTQASMRSAVDSVAEIHGIRAADEPHSVEEPHSDALVIRAKQHRRRRLVA